MIQATLSSKEQVPGNASAQQVAASRVGRAIGCLDSASSHFGHGWTRPSSVLQTNSCFVLVYNYSSNQEPRFFASTLLRRSGLTAAGSVTPDTPPLRRRGVSLSCYSAQRGRKSLLQTSTQKKLRARPLRDIHISNESQVGELERSRAHNSYRETAANPRRRGQPGAPTPTGGQVSRTTLSLSEGLGLEKPPRQAPGDGSPRRARSCPDDELFWVRRKQKRSMIDRRRHLCRGPRKRAGKIK